MANRRIAVLLFVAVAAAGAFPQPAPETATPKRGTVSVHSLVLSDPKLATLKIAVHCKASSLAPGVEETITLVVNVKLN